MWRALRGSGRPIVSWAPVIAWAAMTLVSSAQPSASFAPDLGLDYRIRKAGHTGVLGILRG